MKERITLTLERGILEKVDRSVDGSKIKNRSHAVELLLRKAIGADVPTTALILAGGKTSPRLLKKAKHRSMLDVKGKPVIQHNIELLKKYGIINILIAAGPQIKDLRELLGDGKKIGVEITYLEEKNPLGTAGPLNIAKQYLKETFVMCNADELKDIDVSDMFQFHKSNRSLCTISLTSVKNTSAYGVALLNGNKIITFVEKPPKEHTPSNLISAGLYIIEPEVLNYVPEGFAMLEHDVFPKLASEENLCGYPFSGQWFDAGTSEGHKDANERWRGFLH